MTTTNLAAFETRVRGFLSDANATAYSTAQIDEAIRQALAEYSAVYPREVDTFVTLPAAGREIDLSSLLELSAILEVWWPFDPTANPDVWPPNRVQGYRLGFDDGNPVLTLTTDLADEPQAGDNVRIWYTTPQHLDDLDGAAGTTYPTMHESTLVTGAAAFAAIMRAGDVTSTYAVSPRTQANLESWGYTRLAEFRGHLARYAAQSVVHGPAFAKGWGLDQWEDQGVIYPKAGWRPSPPR
jgi:hypothetical protein